MCGDIKKGEHNSKACLVSIKAVKDALDALNGKWKLPLLIALQEGPRRFNELQRLLGEITPKVLTRELQEMMMNDFIARKVDTGTPVVITYELTPYAASLDKVLNELREWGMHHREKIMGSTQPAA